MCQGKTLSGKICKNPCVKGTLRCRVHSRKESIKNKRETALAKVLEAQNRASLAAEHARKLYEIYQKRYP